MSNIDKQALREAAERAMHDDWGYDTDIFHEQVTPSVVLALLDECAALAAENARLSDIAKGGAFVMQKALMKYEFGVGMTMQAEDFIRDARSKTPATNAVLAEVRAQGVESAGEYLKQYAQGLHEEARLVLQDAGELCNGFAAQLRKGAAL
ncbi:ead/Ea22-like family protein [Salmonella enterica]